MSGENTVVYGTSKTLEANGASITNNSLAEANDATYSVNADGAAFPDAEFVLTGQFGTAPVEGSAVALYARSLDIDGTNDSEVPEALRPTEYIGAFMVNNVTTSQSMRLIARDVPPLASYYLHNNATGQTISAGWVLKVRPRTYKPAA